MEIYPAHKFSPGASSFFKGFSLSLSFPYVLTRFSFAEKLHFPNDLTTEFMGTK